MLGLVHEVAIQRRTTPLIPVPGYSVALGLQVSLEGPNEALFTPGSFDDPVPGRDVEPFDVLGFDSHLSDLGMCKFDWLHGWQCSALPDFCGSGGEGVFVPRVLFPHLFVEIAVVRQSLAIIVGVDCGKVEEFPGNTACVTEALRIWTFGVNLQGSENARELNDRLIGFVESTRSAV